MSIFEKLSTINVNQFTEKKNNLTYLPWAYAWGTLKSLYPSSFYTVAENKDGWNYFTDGRTCWVKCAVTAVDGDDHQTAVEYLPVMDYRNNAVPLDQVTSTLVTKAIQRCLTKAIARLGLGLYIYAGEDLPEEMSADSVEAKPMSTIKAGKPAKPAVVTVKPVQPSLPPAEKPAQASTQPATTISNTVRPAESATPPIITAKPVEPAQKNRTTIVRETCSRLSITEEQFGLCKKMAVWANVIPDAKISALSDDEFNALLDYVGKNYELSA